MSALRVTIRGADDAVAWRLLRGTPNADEAADEAADKSGGGGAVWAKAVGAEARTGGDRKAAARLAKVDSAALAGAAAVASLAATAHWPP